MAILNIVLVEPQIPQNTGNVARTCAATGCRLHLVKPFGFKIDDKKLKRAGLDYWKYLDVVIYEGLNEFLKSNNDKNMYFFTTKAKNVYSSVKYFDDCYLIFGREDAGLPEELLKANPKNCVRMPMGRGIRSLNLSNAVAIGAYEVLRQWNFPSLENEGNLTKYCWDECGPNM